MSLLHFMSDDEIAKMRDSFYKHGWGQNETMWKCWIQAVNYIHDKYLTELSATKEKLDKELEIGDKLFSKLQAAEKRIRESQEQEPVAWYFGYDEMVDGRIVESGVIVEVGTVPPEGYKGQIWEPLYTMPPIPPELAELTDNFKALRNILESTQRENAELRKQLNEFDSIGLAICALSSNSGIENGHDGWSLHVGKLRELLNGEKP